MIVSTVNVNGIRAAVKERSPETRADSLAHPNPRRPDPADRRVRLLSITDAGRAAKDAAQAEIQQGEERWLGELNAEERRVFLKVLQRLTRRRTG